MENPVLLIFTLLISASIVIATGISLANALLYFGKKVSKKNDNQTV